MCWWGRSGGGAPRAVEGTEPEGRRRRRRRLPLPLPLAVAAGAAPCASPLSPLPPPLAAAVEMAEPDYISRLDVSFQMPAKVPRRRMAEGELAWEGGWWCGWVGEVVMVG